MKKKFKLITIIMLFILSLIIILSIPRAIDLSYLYEKFIPLTTTFSSSDILSFYGVFLSFLASTFLGTVALCQAKQANDITKQANDITKQANDISNRMLLLEERAHIPIIDFLFIYSEITKDTNPIYIYNNNNKLNIRVHLKNKSDTIIKSCKLKNAELYSYNTKYSFDSTSYDNSKENRCILPNDQYPYQFYLILDNNYSDISRNESILKNNEIIKSLLPCKNINYSTDPLVKQYYVLYLDFNITNNYNSSYSQSLFCCFTYDINSHILNACTNMLNREILIKD